MVYVRRFDKRALPIKAQYTDAADKTGLLILLIRRSFKDLSKLASIPLCVVLVRLHLHYVIKALFRKNVWQVSKAWRELKDRLVTSLP